MKRLTKKYVDGQAYVSLNQLSTMAENECVGLPITKLARYEDLEEQGRLLIPRFKRGDKVYILSHMTGRISEYIINAICAEEEIGYLVRLNKGFYFTDYFFERQIGKTVFITEEEAEAALEKMKGEEHE